MSSFTDAANAAIAEAETDTGPVDDRPVDVPAAVAAASEAAADEPAEQTEARPVAEVLAERGYDHAELEEFIAATPEAQELLGGREAGRAWTDDDLVRAAAAVDSLRLRSQIHDTVQYLTLEQAKVAYDEGTHDPAELADALKATYGDEVAGQFVEHWRADDWDYEEEDLGRPQSATEWLERERLRWAGQSEANAVAAETARYQQEIDTAAAIQAEVQKTLDSIRATDPNFDRSTEFVRDVAARMAPEDLPTTPEDARAFLERGYRGAQEAARVEETARIQARMEQRFELKDGRGAAPSKAELEHRLERRVSELMGDSFRADAVLAPPTAADEAQAIQDRLTNRQASAKEGWAEWSNGVDLSNTLGAANRAGRDESARAKIQMQTSREKTAAFNDQLPAAVHGNDFRNWPGH